MAEIWWLLFTHPPVNCQCQCVHTKVTCCNKT